MTETIQTVLQRQNNISVRRYCKYFEGSVSLMLLTFFNISHVVALSPKSIRMYCLINVLLSNQLHACKWCKALLKLFLMLYCYYGVYCMIEPCTYWIGVGAELKWMSSEIIDTNRGFKT